MKTKILIGFAIVVAVAVFAESGVKSAQIVFQEKPREDMLERAAKLKVYELQPVRVDRQSFDRRVKQLFRDGLKGEPIQVNGVIGMSDAEKPSNYMMLDLKTGYLSFTRGTANQIDDKPGNLPDDEEAVQIARDFLQNNDLGPGNPKEMVLGRVGRIRSASFDPKTGDKGPVRDQILTVHLARQIDEIPVIGSGSKMIIWIGDGGEVVGGGRRWTELAGGRGLGMRDLRSGDEVIGDIQAFLNREMKEAQRIQIVRTALVYYDNGGRYMQPVLAYEANITSGDLTYAYLGQTALMREPPERVGLEPASREAMQLLKRSSPDERLPEKEAD